VKALARVVDAWDFLRIGLCSHCLACGLSSQGAYSEFFLIEGYLPEQLMFGTPSNDCRASIRSCDGTCPSG
jgi:hypothetical protein